MIKEFTDKWQERKHVTREWLISKMANRKFAFYQEPLYKEVVQMLMTDVLEIKKVEISEFPTDKYSGDQLYIICEYNEDYNSEISKIYHTHNYYGSCYGCDTLERCFYDYGEDNKREQSIKDFMTLCLHLIQRMQLFGFDYTTEDDGDE